MKAVLIRISTQEILKYNVRYPSVIIEPIPSLDEDLRWLLINIIDKPSFDPFTEKLEKVEEITEDAHPDYNNFFQYRISWNVVSKTAQEQADYIQSQEDNDSSSQEQSTHKQSGQIAFDRAYALIVRRKNNGVITANQAKNLSEALYPLLEPLYKGLWQLVKVNLDAANPPANAKLLAIFTIIKDKVDQYVQNNY